MARFKRKVVIIDGVRQDEGTITNYMLVACMVAAMGGLIFGYDSGGVASREFFLKKFFPALFPIDSNEKNHANLYCKEHRKQYINLFTSSIYIAALVASLIASSVTRYCGRNVSMCLAGLIYLVGVSISTGAINFTMLVIGRMFIGVGVGFGIQSILIYLSEMAPPNIRGAINQIFQLNVTVGIVVANYANYLTADIKGGWGWRIALSIAIIPALMLGVGSLFLPNSPNSMLERGQSDKAKELLQKLRGDSDVDQEFQDLVFASEVAKKVDNPWKDIMKPRYRPYLVMCILIPFFQQFSGINAIMFYAPLLFRALGFGEKALMLSSAITGVVNAVSTCVSIALVDSSGRRPLLIVGGIQMSICQAAIATFIAAKFGVSGLGALTKSETDLMVALICFYVAAFAWSWGPLGWLVPSEICPLEIRSAANALNVSVNMLFTFVIAQSSFLMFCHLKFGLFYLFAGFCVIMTVFIYFFLPETKHVPIEDMNSVWKEHWFWGKYIPDDALPDRNAFRNLHVDYSNY
ncbi:sugar transport protein 10-like isoform X1 [Rosa rugosa]|uniref:sugar transport protein 10-like isoform X1 n=1 Tax=Rosa rugosa TaxID=74645 RepID=UPI002B417B9F|nr:sugar transport protein 10-like isoform X1 [Rosa rugosa]